MYFDLRCPWIQLSKFWGACKGLAHTNFSLQGSTYVKIQKIENATYSTFCVGLWASCINYAYHLQITSANQFIYILHHAPRGLPVGKLLKRDGSWIYGLLSPSPHAPRWNHDAWSHYNVTTNQLFLFYTFLCTRSSALSTLRPRLYRRILLIKSSTLCTAHLSPASPLCTSVSSIWPTYSTIVSSLFLLFPLLLLVVSLMFWFSQWCKRRRISLRRQRSCCFFCFFLAVVVLLLLWFSPCGIPRR